MSKEAMKLALEALQKIYIAPEHEDYIQVWWPACEQAITAMREALAEQPAIKQDLTPDQPAQPQQEPVAWANKVVGGKKWLSIHTSKGASDKWLEYRRKEQAWSEQYEQIALYTSPPAQRKPLTDEMVKQMKENCTSMEMRGAFADGWLSAEAAHGITGETQ